MDRTNARQMLTKPQVQRLKQLTDGLEVGQVMGDRVLVKLVTPFTEMDRVEKEGILYVPESAREENTPLPTTGIIVAIGRGVVDPLYEGDMVMFSKYAGSDVYFNEEAFRIMETREVLCTLQARAEGDIVVLPVNEGVVS